MILNIADFFENELKKELKVSHLEKKIDCKVVETSKVNKKMKEAIGKDELKNGDILIGLVEMNAATGQESGVAQDKKEEKNTDTKSDDSVEKNDSEDTVDVPSDDTVKKDNEEDSDSSEDKNDDKSEKDDSEDNASEEDEDDKKKKKDEEVNESVKITDLTSKMLSPIKPSKVKVVPQKKSCVKEGECNIKKPSKKPKAKAAAMPIGPTELGGGEHGTPYAGGDAGGGDAVGAVEEADTEATGEELKVKVLKCLQKLTKEQETDSNKIEIKEVPGMTGVYYVMIKFGTVGVDMQNNEEK